MAAKKPQDYTDSQLRTFEILQRNQMAWIMFWFLLAVFTGILGMLLYSLFWVETHLAIRVGLILLDGLIGWSVKRVVAHLFPTPPK